MKKNDIYETITLLYTWYNTVNQLHFKSKKKKQVTYGQISGRKTI